MEKSRTFDHVFFDQKTINDSLEHLKRLANFEDHFDSQYLRVCFENEEWGHDNLEEFFADYRKEYNSAKIDIRLNGYRFGLYARKYLGDTIVSIVGKTRQEIETILAPFEENKKKFYIEPSKEKTK